MSVSKWAYDPKKCDGLPCPQDCDLCPKRDNLEAGIYSDNPDDQMRYVQTTQPVDLWGYPRKLDDYVLVVRCRDCRHWETIFDADKAENGLCYAFKYSTFVTPRDGFCFKGERKEK